jgi:hypothetical protein
VFEFRRQRVSPGETSKATERGPSPRSVGVPFSPLSRGAISNRQGSKGPLSSGPLANGPLDNGPLARAPVSSRSGDAAAPRELPDVTGFLVVVLVTLGLFVVPVGATIMQGPAIVASIFGR